MFRRKQAVQPLLTHDERIAEAEGQLQSALDIFEQAKQNVVKANSNLDKVIEEAQADVERATKTITDASAKKQRNDALYNKFSEMTLSE